MFCHSGRRDAISITRKGIHLLPILRNFQRNGFACNLKSSSSVKLSGAVADESSRFPRSLKTAGKQGASSAVPSNPNSRLGRKASSIAQGWEKMDVFVGVDVSKDRLDVHVLPQDESFSVERNGRGLAALVERLRPLLPSLIVVEATGGFESTTAAALASAGLPVVIVNPGQIRHYAQALGKRAKTDAIDAMVIARFAADIRPEVRTLPDEMTQFLADLVARRRQIVEMLQGERQREKRATMKRVKKRLARLIAALEKELAELDQEIHDTVRGSPAWREKEDLLASVPGVGLQTARTLLAEMPEVGSLDRKSVASLAGLAPYTRQSGHWKGKSMIGGGRKTVRSAVFIAAMVACRYNPALKAFYERLLKAGKSKVLAITAVARKLLTILNAILRDKTPWQPA